MERREYQFFAGRSDYYCVGICVSSKDFVPVSEEGVPLVLGSIMALQTRLNAESANGARAPWSTGLQKNLKSINFYFKKFRKKPQCGEYYDPSMRKFSTTNSLYFDLCKKREIWPDFKFFRFAHCSPIQICRFLFFAQIKIQGISD